MIFVPNFIKIKRESNQVHGNSVGNPEIVISRLTHISQYLHKPQFPKI